ncbi:MAG: low affinity iron permease family protein [Gemmataceae bacterium]
MSKFLERIAVWTTDWVGSSWAFLSALALALLWLLAGGVFGFSDSWQLVMNTVSSVVTFLMVFLLQRAQNKESLVTQVKLNELLAAKRGASNRLINLEQLSEEEIRELHRRFQELANRSSAAPKQPCSIEEVTP